MCVRRNDLGETGFDGGPGGRNDAGGKRSRSEKRPYMVDGPAQLRFEIPAVIHFDQDLNFAAKAVPEGYESYFVTPALRAKAFATRSHPPGSVSGQDWAIQPPFSNGFWRLQPREQFYQRRRADGLRFGPEGVAPLLCARSGSRFSVRNAQLERGDRKEPTTQFVCWRRHLALGQELRTV
jgi:hypothetical protein